MEWIGFIATLFVGGWLTVAGFFLSFFASAFGGRAESLFSFVAGLCGLAVLWAAFKYAPFTIVIGAG